MKVNNEPAWVQQYAELGADEDSLKFREFLVTWVDEAEAMLAGSPVGTSPHQVLSKAFEVTEQSLGFLSVEWASQMLLVIVQHWDRGEEVWESLTVFEKRMVEQATAIKLAELQAEAEGVSPETPTV